VTEESQENKQPESPSPKPPDATPPPTASEDTVEAPQLPELVRNVCAAIPELKPYSAVSDTPAVEVTPENLVKSLTTLRDSPDFAFALLIDHTAIDRIDDGQFELVYRLYSITTLAMLLVSTKIPRDNPVIATVCEIWRIAEWQEREVYDLFGVLYDNHPDLRRVFLEDDWKGFPLRKDYEDDFMLTLDVDKLR
jgi:NADH-quinone oxidoreductase subunit C